MLQPSRGVIAAILLCCAVCFSAGGRAATPAVSAEGNADALYESIERGRQALLADKFVEAGQAFDETLRNPQFEALPQTVQFLTLYFAAFAASGREDFLGAHEFIVLATEYPEVAAEHWAMRARLAYWVENWQDAGKAITTLAKRWPKSLAEVNAHLVQRTAYKLKQDRQLGPAHMDMLEALFAAGFTLEWNAQPAGLWEDLALDALQKQDLKRARQVLKRIDDPNTLVRMRIDRRYDALLRAEPKAFDIAAAAQAEAKRWRELTRANPRKLAPLVQYTYALYLVGDFQRMIELADRAVAQNARGTKDKPAFEDEDATEQMDWIYDNKSRALRRLGQWNAALAAQEAAARRHEGDADKVSQAINLGFAYNYVGRPEDALKALDGIDWGKQLSGYGRMQLQHVRLRAYLQLGKRDEAEKVFAFMRENRDDAEDSWQLVMLDWGDLDGAAALFVSRLRDPDQRLDALYSAQQFRDRPRLPEEIAEEKRWQSLMDRKDVIAALEEVGRREQQPIYTMLD